MISIRGWFLLFLVYSLYLVIGGFTFQALECDEAKTHKVPPKTYYAFFYNQMKGKYLEKSNQTNPDCERWNFYNSVFFSFTALTTIGFGHLAPETWQGKVFCIFYSLLGVPINGILVGYLAAFFGSKLQKFKRKVPLDDASIKDFMILSVQVIGYLIPGFVVFMAVPAVVFWHIEEGWTYLDSLYFAFITLMTIGFGDYVAGRDVDVLERLGNWKVVYEIGLIIWILFGLGYIFMIINIITDSITTPAIKAAKKIAVAERIMVEKILREIVRNKTKADSTYCSNHGGSKLDEILTDDRLADVFHFHEDQRTSSKPVSFSGDFFLPPNLASSKQPSEIHYGSTTACNEDHYREINESQAGIDISISLSKAEADECPDDMIDGANDDTITSLHHFIKTAKLVHRSLHGINGSASSGDIDANVRHRNSASVSSSPELNQVDRSFSKYKPPSRFSRFKETFRAMGRVADKNQDTLPETKTGEKSRPGFRTILRGYSGEVLSNSMSAASSCISCQWNQPQSVLEVLRNTTVEEFINAMDKVKHDDREHMISQSNKSGQSHSTSMPVFIQETKFGEEKTQL